MSGINLLESFSGLAAFSMAVDTGSFAAAGRKLGLSASAVGKAVDRLEQRLNAKLLTRTTRALALTLEGELLHAYAARVLEQLQEAEHALQASQTTPCGTLKVSVPTVIGRRLVLPLLKEFLETYPEITLDIRLEDLKVDVIDGGYDVVLRLGDLEDSNFCARRVGPHRFRTCASPGYLERRGTPQTPADLAAHDCIHYRFPTSGRTEVWAFKDQPPFAASKSSILLNDGEALGAAALAALGIVQVPEYLVAADIAEGRLVSLLDDHAMDRGVVSLLWPPARGSVPRVRAFIDFMSNRLSQAIG